MCGFGEEVAGELLFLEAMYRDVGVEATAAIAMAPTPGSVGDWQINVSTDEGVLLYQGRPAHWGLAIEAAKAAIASMVMQLAEARRPQLAAE